MSEETDTVNFYKTDILAGIRGCFVGISGDSFGTEYGPIFNQYSGPTRFIKLRISPMTRIIVYNDGHFNGIGKSWDNKTNNVMHLDIQNLIKIGKLDQAVSYRVIALSHSTGTNWYLFVFFISTLFMLLTLVLILFMNDRERNDKGSES